MASSTLTVIPAVMEVSSRDLTTIMWKKVVVHGPRLGKTTTETTPFTNEEHEMWLKIKKKVVRGLMIKFLSLAVKCPTPYILYLGYKSFTHSLKM